MKPRPAKRGEMRVTVSGSFNRHLDQILEIVEHATLLGVTVLSPSDPRAVDVDGGFIYVASDRHRSPRLVEDRHLAAITQSDFIWLVNPDGYVGPSAAFELGFAIASSVPVYSDTRPSDLTMRLYVRLAESIDQAITIEANLDRVPRVAGSLLVSPSEVAQQLHAEIDHAAGVLLGTAVPKDGEEPAISELSRRMRSLRRHERLGAR